jgi:hypothetical protein
MKNTKIPGPKEVIDTISSGYNDDKTNLEDGATLLEDDNKKNRPR